MDRFRQDLEAECLQHAHDVRSFKEELWGVRQAMESKRQEDEERFEAYHRKSEQEMETRRVESDERFEAYRRKTDEEMRLLEKEMLIQQRQYERCLAELQDQRDGVFEEENDRLLQKGATEIALDFDEKIAHLHKQKKETLMGLQGKQQSKAVASGISTPSRDLLACLDTVPKTVDGRQKPLPVPLPQLDKDLRLIIPPQQDLL